MATTGSGQPTPRGSNTENNKGANGKSNQAAGSGAEGTRDRRPAGKERNVAQTVRDTAYERLGDGQRRAGDVIGTFAEAVREMTDALRDGGQPWAADYVNVAANRLEGWASELRREDLRAAIRRIERFARSQPGLFVGLSLATGVLAARLLKSSNADADDVGHWRQRATAPRGLASDNTASATTDFGAAQYGTTSGDIPRVPPDSGGGRGY